MAVFQYTALEKIKSHHPVRRVKAITSECSRRLVLDLGALDETAYLDKQSNKMWLHHEISIVAKQVIGVDNSNLVPSSGLAPYHNSIIINCDILKMHQHPAIESVFFDVIVAGELIEHIASPLEFLKEIKHIPHKKIILSTPNACNFHNFFLGLFNRESMHKDHVGIYSRKSLSTILTSAGFSHYRFNSYYAEFPEMIEKSSGLKKTLVLAFQYSINALEFFFPILSAGIIVTINSEEQAVRERN